MTWKTISCETNEVSTHWQTTMAMQACVSPADGRNGNGNLLGGMGTGKSGMETGMENKVGKRQDAKTGDSPNEVANDPREVVNEVAKTVLAAIQAKPGIKKPELQAIVGKSHATIERTVDLLKRLSKIEYRGSDKTGGYYALKQGV